MSTGQGWGRGGRKGASWPELCYDWGGPPVVEKHCLPSGLRGWCLMPGCSPDLFQAVPSSEQAQPASACFGRQLPCAAAAEGLLLLPLSLTRLCFLQQLRAKDAGQGHSRRRCVWKLGSQAPITPGLGAESHWGGE